jgi:hypothetical protein
LILGVGRLSTFILVSRQHVREVRPIELTHQRFELARLHRHAG